MDIKIAFTSQARVADAAQAFEAARRLAKRLRIAHRPASISRRPNRFPHGFTGMDAKTFRRLTPRQRERFTVREMDGRFYLLENGPLEQSPYYRLRVRLLEEGREWLEGEIEALGLHVALHPNMFTFDLRLISLYFDAECCGPFVGRIFPNFAGARLFPGSEIEERTGLFGPLVHMQLVEFLAALRREAIPSLYIRDPSGYLNHGDVRELQTTFAEAGLTYQSFIEALAIPPDATAEQIRELKAFWKLPAAADNNLALPDLSGAVGGAERIAGFAEFLANNGISPVDIDALLAEGR